jgi:hypothetical protein
MLKVHIGDRLEIRFERGGVPLCVLLAGEDEKADDGIQNVI